VSASDQDIALVSGSFFEKGVPKNKRYLLKYFDSEVAAVFVSYFLIFRSHTHFVDHTGFRVGKRWLRKSQERIDRLENAYGKARSAGDFSAVAEIESGRYNL